MDLYQPRSFLKLVLIGFLLVTLPLIVALIYAARYMDSLREQSQQAVMHAVQLTEKGGALVDLIKGMERNARQYQVLHDASIFRAYQDGHAKFSQIVARLDALRLNPLQARELGALARGESALYQIVRDNPPGSTRATAAMRDFEALLDAAYAFFSDNNQVIHDEVRRLRATSDRAQRVFIAQAVALIAGTLVAAGVFTLLISRPIRHIDLAIRRLGDGHFDEEVRVKGPRDLEYLGRRLDWLRRRLTALQEQKTKFLRHISHELKTPLSAIREGAELLSEGVVGPLNVQQAEIARILRDNGKWLQKLIDDMLSFNLAQTHALKTPLAPVWLDDIVREVTLDHKPAVLNKGARIETRLARLCVDGDEAKLRVIVDNLLSNAVKFAPPHSVIALTLRAVDGAAVLDVIDAGPGVDPEDRARVFDAFYQGRPPASGHIRGSGLGLAIVKEYLNAHRGGIEIMDSARGAHFRVRLPCIEERVAYAS